MITAQYTEVEEFLRMLDLEERISGPHDNGHSPRYNIAPSTHVTILRASEQGVVVDEVTWGWAPHWANRMPKPINARIEKVATNNFYRQIWPYRCLVLADGWYEWVKEGTAKQPYYIHLKSKEPMFFAGIGQFDGQEASQGFVIITADSAGGMVDIHDRRPAVLAPDAARAWLSSETTKGRAETIMSELGRSADDFDWYPVSKAVGNVRNQGEGLIKSELL